MCKRACITFCKYTNKLGLILKLSVFTSSLNKIKKQLITINYPNFMTHYSLLLV